MRVVVVTPPPLKPSEPGLSGAAAASRLAAMGADVRWIDASMGWHRHALEPARLRRAIDGAGARVAPGDRRALLAAADRMGERPHPLQREATYADRGVYTSAVADLENALAAAALATPGVRLGVAMIAFEGERLESSAALARIAARPGPFDGYFDDELLPAIAAERPDAVAISLTFQQQAPAALRLARRLREALPGARRVLGGPLVACWAEAGLPVTGPLFADCDAVVHGTDADLAALAGAPAAPGPAAVLGVPMGDAPWADYLAPRPVVPAALGRGCHFGRCTFCPDHLHRGHAPSAMDALDAWLHAVAERFPSGAMLHLTDSALPPLHLARIADVIARDGLPLAWHGFVRAEAVFAEPGFAERLARGGCAMLQFGIESGSPDVLRRLGKGVRPEQARRVLAATAAAGIRNHVYLLFGTPSETERDRDLTLAFVRDEHAHIHAINASLLNLPLDSLLYRHAPKFGITEILPFSGDTDLSLAVDFRCGSSHPRREARQWMASRFLKDDRVKAINGRLRASFKANHLCFLAS
jgi:hypothetical protein